MSQTSATKEGATKTVAFGNRRAAIRYRCAPATVGKVHATDQRDFQFAWVLDLSLRGVGMQVPRSFESGQHILIAIKSHDAKRTFDLSAHVMHCKPLPQGEWYVGCELTIPLTPDELDQLL